MSKPKKFNNKFTFWYHINEISADQEYESQIKKLAEFETLEDFWAIFQYLKKPDDCKQAIEFQLFKNNIKPMWEDESNKDGGRISLKLRKEFSNLVWEELVFAFIGGYLGKDLKDEINGLVINCKKDFNTLQIWIKTYSNDVTSALEKNVREILSMPSEVALDIKPFNQPQKDYNNYNNNYNNNYHNYNNYKGYNQKKKQNNNYYKKKESHEAKEYKNNYNNEGKKNNEKENKEDDKNANKAEEDNTKKEKDNAKEKEVKKEKTKEKETKKEETVEKKESKESNEEFTQVKKKKI